MRMPLSWLAAAGAPGIVAALCLAGCAHRPSAATPGWGAVREHVQVEMDSALWRAADSVSLVRGAVRFDGPQALFGYHARYALDRNAAPVVPGAEPGPATALGEEQFGHGVGARLPLFFSSAPLQVDIEERAQAVLTPLGNIDSETRVAKLSWAPPGVVLGVNWQDSGQVLTHTLVCGMDGHLRLPLPGTRRPQTLELSGRECAVVAPDRGFEDLSVQAWSASWSRQGRRTLSGLRLTVLEPASDPAWNGPNELPPAYELDLSHSRPFGPFQASTALRLRHVEPGAQPAADTRWSAEARLTRELQPFTLTASLSHAPDPLWFLAAPGMDLHRSQIGLGLSFKRWVNQALATPNADLGLSMNWSEPLLLAQSPESAVRWNFSWTW